MDAATEKLVWTQVLRGIYIVAAVLIVVVAYVLNLPAEAQQFLLAAAGFLLGAAGVSRPGDVPAQALPQPLATSQLPPL